MRSTHSVMGFSSKEQKENRKTGEVEMGGIFKKAGLMLSFTSRS